MPSKIKRSKQKIRKVVGYYRIEPDYLAKARRRAALRGFDSLSAHVRHLILRDLRVIADEAA